MENILEISEKKIDNTKNTKIWVPHLQLLTEYPYAEIKPHFFSIGFWFGSDRAFIKLLDIICKKIASKLMS